MVHNHLLWWCLGWLGPVSQERGVHKPAHILTAKNTTLAFIRGERGRQVAVLRFVHNESSMCVFVCVCGFSECLIKKALGWPWYPAARLAVIETDFIMNFKHRSNLLHQITESTPPFSFYSFTADLPPPTCLWWFGKPAKRERTRRGKLRRITKLTAEEKSVVWI